MRADLLLGLACFVLFLVVMSGEVTALSLVYAAGLVALFLFIPGVTQLLWVVAFFAPAFLVFVLASAGWELWHGPGDEARVTPPAEPGRSGAKTMKGWRTMR